MHVNMPRVRIKTVTSQHESKTDLLLLNVLLRVHKRDNVCCIEEKYIIIKTYPENVLIFLLHLISTELFIIYTMYFLQTVLVFQKSSLYCCASKTPHHCCCCYRIIAEWKWLSGKLSVRKALCLQKCLLSSAILGKTIKFSDAVV